jgi:hypothetical protein
MAITLAVRVGVEWIETFPPETQSCGIQWNLSHQRDQAAGFLGAMMGHGHQKIFHYAEKDVWPTDFEHPSFGGDSLNYIDNVHFFYYADHGGTWSDEFHIGFADMGHGGCLSDTSRWRLGVKQLKWAVFDACDAVIDPNNADQIWNIWGSPIQGAHMVFGFIGDCYGNPNRGRAFANAVSGGASLAIAWMDSAFRANPHDSPIAIAAGVDRNDAINRRENENLNWRDANIAATGWLAWKWRT